MLNGVFGRCKAVNIGVVGHCRFCVLKYLEQFLYPCQGLGDRLMKYKRGGRQGVGNPGERGASVLEYATYRHFSPSSMQDICQINLV